MLDDQPGGGGTDTRADVPLAGHLPALDWLPGRYEVVRFDPDAALPGWVSAALALTAAAPQGSFLAVVRTPGELSVVAPEAVVVDAEAAAPHAFTGVPRQRGYAALAVRGPLEFSMVGLLAALAGALRVAQVPVLAISTFDTDLLLVPHAQADAAGRALAAITTVHGHPPGG